MGLPLWPRGSTAGGIGLVPGCRTEILAKKKKKKKGSGLWPGKEDPEVVMT